ncbi:MAG: protein kinase [Blastocatellia bacterium]|nr:protein kinase [Blastocatellia bacterium]
MKSLLSILGICFLLGFALNVLAAPFKGTIPLKRFGVEQGLSQAGAGAILQDRTGFLWIGTQDGLNRYDGYTFKVFRNQPGDATSLAANDVRALCEDQTGALWVGTLDGGLSRYDHKTESFQTFRVDPAAPTGLSSNNIRALWVDTSGLVWIGTSGGGLSAYDTKASRFVNLSSWPQNPNNQTGQSILSIFQDGEGTLWFGTQEKGLCRFDLRRNLVTRYWTKAENPVQRLPGDDVQAITSDGKGNLWIGTTQGLVRLNLPGQTITVYQAQPNTPRTLAGNDVRTVCVDRQGILWVGSANGIDRYDPADGGFDLVNSSSPLPGSLTSNDLRTIVEDRQGILWVGTGGGGVYAYAPQAGRFRTYRNVPNDAASLGSNIVWSFTEAPNGEIWVGTDDGLCRLDPLTGRFRTYRNNPANPNSLSHNTVLALAVDQSGAVWAGTRSGGICRFEPGRDNFTVFRHDPQKPDSIPSDIVRGLTCGRDGTLWISTRGGGLGAFDPKTGTCVTYRHDPNRADSLASDEMRLVYEDQTGLVWVGTYGSGLCVLDRTQNRFTTWKSDPKNPNSLGNDTIWAMCEDKSGALWVGTNGGGLSRFDRSTQSFQTFRTGDGLPNDLILGILEDGLGRLWISTNRGISRFDPQKREFRNFDASDGLQSNEFCSGACAKTKTGEMYFGGINGFNVFQPEAVTDSTYLPPVVLTGFKRFNQPVKLAQSITDIQEVTVDYRDHFITFEFAALGFVNPEKNQYKFKLEGFDQDWIPAGTLRTATYTNLDGGSYVFHVKASNADGVWNEQGASLRVIVIPPPWKRWWAYTLYFLVAGGSVLGFVRFQTNRLRHQAALKEANLRATAAEMQAQANQARFEAAAIQARAAEQLAQQNEELDRKNFELDRMLSELRQKNEELVESQQRADRIFSVLAEALPGTVLEGKYRLDEKIGSGGFGAVFRATHLTLNRPVAVKVFRPSPGNDSAEAVERFRLEGVSASRLNHPNAIAILDSGISVEGIAYLVMELLQGRTLAEELRESKVISLERTVQILRPVCSALAEAHRLGIIHRDIKPDNVFLHQPEEGGEVVKVLDFGIAKFLGPTTDEMLGKLTVTGGIIGTPTYIAPERLQEGQYDGKADVYSVGVMTYEMLTGKPPFPVGPSGVVGVIMAQLNETPPLLRPQNPNVTPEIEVAVFDALEKTPENRPTAREFIARYTRVVYEALEAEEQNTLDVPEPEDESQPIALEPTQMVAREDKPVPHTVIHPITIEQPLTVEQVEDETVDPETLPTMKTPWVVTGPEQK